VINVAVHPRTGKSPEVLVKMMITVIEKTPHGGATMEELKEAYCDVKDTQPDDRTIYRNIRRINELFNPHAYTSDSQKTKPGNKTARSKAANPKALTISSKNDGAGVTRYLYTGRKLVSKYDSNQVLLIILGLYSQQRSIQKDHFEKVMSTIMADVIHRQKDGESFFTEIEEHVHVSGQGTIDSKKLLRKIAEIIRAIDECKVVKIDYVRTYDGERRTREVEPYGLVCRHGNWYLYGLCREHQKNRIYLLGQIQWLKVVENSSFKRPAAFKMKEVFGSAWGIMVTDDAQKAKVETVRLRVKKGVAERFKAVSFHDSQQVKCLPHDEAEVCFEVSGAGEMIPWLMSWGPTLQVLEPQWLKDQLIAYVQEIANVYQ
jgi:predicted DNA-binding transcriptional regulator YafY